MSEYTVEEVIAAYVNIRDVKRTMEAEHEEALKPINEKLEKMETWLLGMMQNTGVDSFKTKNGTAYKSVKTSCQMADQAMFKQVVFAPLVKVIEDRTGYDLSTEILGLPMWNLVDFRALKKGVEEYIEDHNQVPPGLNVTQTTTVNVRSK